MDAGIDVVDQNYTTNWDFIGSVFFTTTILTTIGYVEYDPASYRYSTLSAAKLLWFSE